MVERRNFFHINLVGFEIWTNCSKMHQNAPFWGNFPKISRGRPPGPPPAGGMTPSPTLPLSALRASVKPSASGLGAPTVVNCAPEEKKLDTPVDWSSCSIRDVYLHMTVADPELNLGGGGFSRPEGPSGEGTGGLSPPVGGGSGGLHRENFEKMMQNCAFWSANEVF